MALPEGRPVLHLRDLWNLAGALTLARLPLAVITPFFKHDRLALAAILAAAVLTDMLDGFVARRQGTVTRTGAVVDGWLDKIFLVNFAWSLELAGYISPWHMLLWFLREFVQGVTIPLLAWRYFVGDAPWPEHSSVGKAATTLIGVAMIAALAQVRWVIDAATILGGALGLWAALGYVHRDFFKRP